MYYNLGALTKFDYVSSLDHEGIQIMMESYLFSIFNLEWLTLVNQIIYWTVLCVRMHKQQHNYVTNRRESRFSLKYHSVSKKIKLGSNVR